MKWWIAAGCLAVAACSGGTAQGPGDPAGGDTAGGDVAGGDSAGGDAPGGDTAGGDTATGDTMAGDTLGGDSGPPPGIMDWSSPPLPFDAGILYTAELYVTEGGNDITGDGSMGMPLRTIGEAITQATAGTRINVASGTYPVVGSHSPVGLVDAPIAIVGEAGATIDAGGSGTGLGFSDARYVVVEGLTIQNTGVHGFNIDDGGTFATPSEYLIFRNLHFQNIGSGGNNDCLKMSGIDHFWILGSEFEGCNMGEAIDMVGCHEGVIEGNHFHDVAQNAVQTKGGSADVLVYRNLFENIPGRAVNSGGSTGESFFRPQDAEYEGARIQIVSNVFVWTSVDTGVAVAYVGCDTCVFANNTIVEPNTYAGRMLHENTNHPASRNGYFINNIVVFNSSDMSGFTFFNASPGHDTTGSTFVISNNLWYSQDDGGFSGPPVAAPIAGDTNSVIQQDPALQGDYSILGTSPAVGQGRAVPREIPGDYAQNAFGSPPAIGAFAAP